MVHYIGDEDWRTNTSYWRLQPLHYHIPASGRPVLSLAGTREFMIYSRRQRGMIIYDDCTADELQTFCTSRGLPCPKKARTLAEVAALRAMCTARLENLDDNECTFERFLDLPPEIRLHVYTWYERWVFFDDTDLGIPPPIAAVSREVREESLPVFCDSLVFQCYNTWDHETYEPMVRLDDQIETMFKEAPESMLRRIRQLHIYCCNATYPWDDGFWRFDLRNKSDDHGILCESAEEYVDSEARVKSEQGKQVLIEKMEITRKALKDLADRIAARPRLEFRREDADSIVEALNAKPAQSQAIDSENDQS